MPPSDNQFSAGEQALGYLYQFRYALFQTLRLPEQTVCFIEKDDDIDFSDPDEGRILASLKHKAPGDALTDLSPDFWKSVRIWLDYYLKHDISTDPVSFFLFPFRLDLSHLTVVADRPERPVPMSKTGGGANHLAYHLGAMLALHQFTSNNKKPMPSFLFIDQPTQVYFPSEQVYKAASGTVEETERDSDLEKVRKLFAMLHRFAAEECPGFQIIVTEHANLRDDWFQNSLVEGPWTKPPALVPDDWESA